MSQPTTPLSPQRAHALLGQQQQYNYQPYAAEPQQGMPFTPPPLRAGPSPRASPHDSPQLRQAQAQAHYPSSAQTPPQPPHQADAYSPRSQHRQPLSPSQQQRQWDDVPMSPSRTGAASRPVQRPLSQRDYADPAASQDSSFNQRSPTHQQYQQYKQYHPQQPPPQPQQSLTPQSAQRTMESQQQAANGVDASRLSSFIPSSGGARPVSVLVLDDHEVAHIPPPESLAAPSASVAALPHSGAQASPAASAYQGAYGAPLSPSIRDGGTSPLIAGAGAGVGAGVRSPVSSSSPHSPPGHAAHHACVFSFGESDGDDSFGTNNLTAYDPQYGSALLRRSPAHPVSLHKLPRRLAPLSPPAGLAAAPDFSNHAALASPSNPAGVAPDSPPLVSHPHAHGHAHLGVDDASSAAASAADGSSAAPPFVRPNLTAPPPAMAPDEDALVFKVEGCWDLPPKHLLIGTLSVAAVMLLFTCIAFGVSWHTAVNSTTGETEDFFIGHFVAQLSTNSSSSRHSYSSVSDYRSSCRIDNARVPVSLGLSIPFLLLACWSMYKRRAHHGAHGWRRTAVGAWIIFGGWSFLACVFWWHGCFAYVMAAVDDKGQLAYNTVVFTGGWWLSMTNVILSVAMVVAQSILYGPEQCCFCAC